MAIRTELSRRIRRAFVAPEGWGLHRTLRAIDRNTTRDRVPAGDLAEPARWLVGAAEMEARHGIPVRAVASVRDAVTGADLVVTTTPAEGTESR